MMNTPTSPGTGTPAGDDRLDEAILAYMQAADAGRPLDTEQWLARYPELTAELRAFLEDHDRLPSALEGLCVEVPAPNLTGSRFHDYELLEEIGRGGMGVVYRARQVSLGRVVALKMILADGQAGPAELARFRAEAQAMARLQHPAIIQVYEIGEHQGKPFLCMEFCPGGNLSATLRAGPLAAGAAAALVRVLAGAMQAAHEAGIVHRDLKPANVLLSAGSFATAAAEEANAKRQAAYGPKVTDFGLAKLLDQQGQTQTGSVLGTPSYMAPEQAEGKKNVGPAADIYALSRVHFVAVSPDGKEPWATAGAAGEGKAACWPRLWPGRLCCR
jgi:serine/threonine-protein kinase